jgi:predicted nucleotidyltransferase
MTDAELDLLEKSMEPIYEQIERNLVYSNNPAFNKEERKTFIFYRDKVKMAEMKEAVKLAREYYKIITLNGKTNLKNTKWNILKN